LESDVFTSLLSPKVLLKKAFSSYFKHFIMHKTATDLQAQWIQQPVTNSNK